MGSFLAASKGVFSCPILILSFLTTIFLQVLSNLANDYGDTVHGADSDQREGPSRMVQAGHISPRSMKLAMGVFALLSLVFGVWLIRISLPAGPSFYLFLAMGILAIVGAVTYTVGYKPYGYMGLGDLSVFIFFGWLGVIGTYYLHTHAIDWTIFLPASTCSFFAVGVLNLNNIRDIESDAAVGKRSIPVRIGRPNAVKYHAFLLITGLLCAALYAWIHYRHPINYFFLIVTPMLYINIKAAATRVNAQELDPFLKQLAITSLIFTLTFGIGQVL
ncbi:UNVERIFIED_CONTAM: hypothetical protein GTU68_009947 [Idotea baltica]|nr:hypothetical protein [Idotea baltica]